MKIVMEFSKENCLPCKLMEPIWNQFKAKNVRKDITFREEGIYSPKLIEEYGIASAPTFLFLDGTNEIGRITGRTTLKKLQEEFDRLVST